VAAAARQRWRQHGGGGGGGQCGSTAAGAELLQRRVAAAAAQLACVGGGLLVAAPWQNRNVEKSQYGRPPKIWWRWPANAAKLWQKKKKRKKKEKSLSIQQSIVAKLNTWNGLLLQKKCKKNWKSKIWQAPNILRSNGVLVSWEQNFTILKKIVCQCSFSLVFKSLWKISLGSWRWLFYNTTSICRDIFLDEVSLFVQAKKISWDLGEITC
jgi:hypothetical protein